MKKIISIIFCAIFLGAAIYLTYANINVYIGSSVGFGTKIENFEKLTSGYSDVVDICDYILDQNEGNDVEKPEVQNKSFTISVKSNAVTESDSIKVTSNQNIKIYVTEYAILANVVEVSTTKITDAEASTSSTTTVNSSYDLYLSTDNYYYRLNSFDANIIGGSDTETQDVKDAIETCNKYIGKWVNESIKPISSIVDAITATSASISTIKTIIEDNEEYFTEKGLKKELVADDDNIENYYSKVSVDFSDSSSVKTTLTINYEQDSVKITGTSSYTLTDVNNTVILFLKNTKIYTKTEIEGEDA